MSKPKQGKQFEELVTWINRCLHEKAVITPNDKIRDVHSKRLRQVDIAIRLKDGPTNILSIIEVRDRSRPVGEDYIEQVSAKRTSVGADAAFVVSASGFYAAAIEKARALNIRLFTYQEAVSSDWTQCLQLREINEFLKRWDKVRITFLDQSTNCIINPHPLSVRAIRADPNALIFLNQHGEPKRSIHELFVITVNANTDQFFGGMTFVDPRQQKRVVVNVEPADDEVALFFRDSAGQLRRLEKFLLDAEVWVELRKTPVRVSKYCDVGTGKTLAEVASTSIEAWGGQHKLDFIAKFGEDGGAQLLVRMQKHDPAKEN